MTNSKFAMFMADNAKADESVKYVASKRFVDGDKPVEWEIKAIDSDLDELIRKECTKKVPVPGKRGQYTPETDTDTGFYGDLVGTCPVCGKNVVKGRYGYGCLGYKEGCKFRIGSFICKRTVSISNARKILTEGRSAEIKGFISKNGKPFDAYLKLDGDKVVFEFK